jgi:hypothetical protein
MTDDESRRMCNLQGVSGVTLSSQMVDAYSVPYFAYCLAQPPPEAVAGGLSPVLRERAVQFAELHVHAAGDTRIDEPVSRVCVHG